jgi:hypothetical protein
MMQRIVGSLALAGLTACGGGGGSLGGSSTSAPPQAGNVSLMVSDAPSDDWATIGVRVLSIALVPQGGGSAVTVYTAPTPAPMINLVQLDQLAEILGNVSVPVGTYVGATLTVSANSGAVLLVASSDPEAGFAGLPGATVDPSSIEVQGAIGSAGNLTVPVDVKFVAPLVVNANGNDALDLEVDLSHPAFIVAHKPAAVGTTLWAVNFAGPVRHHPIRDITHLVLRHLYGSVTTVAADNSSVTIDRVLPALPVANPEIPVSTSHSLTVLADATNGTIFYDVDTKSKTIVKDFSTVASVLSKGEFVRVAARYQQNGTLVATRIWASSTFNAIWLSPEGHVVHVDAANDELTVLDATGAPVRLKVDANTEFTFHGQSINAAGPAFLANIYRGFKVHASAIDPLAAPPLVAESVDIETAAFSGRISAASATGFDYTRNFVRATDDYAVTLTYISGSTANGTDGSDNPVTGFKYWDFAYPTLVTTGANAASDFVAATNGGVNFGGTAGAIAVWGLSAATWADPANPTGWSARWAALLPTPLPLGTVATAFSGNTFALSVLGGANPVTVDVSTASGSATLVYQIDRKNGIITVSPVDVTTSDGLTAVTNGLVAGAPVKVYGVPQADGTLKAYVLAYYTGDTMPSD